MGRRDGCGLGGVEWDGFFIFVCAGSCLSAIAIGDTSVYYIWYAKGCPMADKPWHRACLSTRDVGVVKVQTSLRVAGCKLQVASWTGKKCARGRGKNGYDTVTSRILPRDLPTYKGYAGGYVQKGKGGSGPDCDMGMPEVCPQCHKLQAAGRKKMRARRE